jgi:hypothetical protein
MLGMLRPELVRWEQRSHDLGGHFRWGRWRMVALRDSVLGMFRVEFLTYEGRLRNRASREREGGWRMILYPLTLNRRCYD